MRVVKITGLGDSCGASVYQHWFENSVPPPLETSDSSVRKRQGFCSPSPNVGVGITAMTWVSSRAAEGPSLFSLFKVALPGVTFKVLILP